MSNDRKNMWGMAEWNGVWGWAGWCVTCHALMFRSAKAQRGKFPRDGARCWYCARGMRRPEVSR